MEETRDRKINAFRISLNLPHCRGRRKESIPDSCPSRTKYPFYKVTRISKLCPPTTLHLGERLHLGGTKMRYLSQHFLFLDMYLPPLLPISSNCLFLLPHTGSFAGLSDREGRPCGPSRDTPPPPCYVAMGRLLINYSRLILNFRDSHHYSPNAFFNLARGPKAR